MQRRVRSKSSTKVCCIWIGQVLCLDRLALVFFWVAAVKGLLPLPLQRLGLEFLIKSRQ